MTTTTTPNQLLIGPGTVLASEGLFEDWGVLVEGPIIKAVGAYPELEKAHGSAENLERLDAGPGGKGLILPGLINAHTRLHAALARGIVQGDPAPQDAHERYERTLWRLEKVMTRDDVEHAALLALLDCARNGVTTVIAQHSSPGCVVGSLDVLADAIDKVGLRGSICCEVTDRFGEAAARDAMAENLRFWFESRKRPGGKVRGHFGLHSAYAIGDVTSDRLRTIHFVAGPIVTLHLVLAEDSRDRSDARKRGTTSPVERLRKAGMLNERSICAHGVNLNDEDLIALADLGASIVHLPRSNMTTGAGRARVEEMLSRGITVGLGTDGLDTNMIAEMRTAALLLRHEQRRADAGVMEAWRMVFEGNPIIASRLLPRPPGAIAPASPADIICLDYSPLTPCTPDNFVQHLFEGVSGSDVRHTICAGKVIMKDRTFPDLDEPAIRARARELAAAAWERMPGLPPPSPPSDDALVLPLPTTPAPPKIQPPQPVQPVIDDGW
ncbi:MAG: amidohydrolase family protein [Planctomycetota bacterium]